MNQSITLSQLVLTVAIGVAFPTLIALVGIMTNNGRFNSIDSRFTGIETRFGGIENRLANIESLLGDARERLAKVEERLEIRVVRP